MRHLYIRLIALGTLIVTGDLFAGDEVPYEAVILEQGAEVRAGAGRRFYVTQELEPGMRVEVYRRDAGNWLAIRPPDGSFSWVPESDLQMTEEPGVAEVISEETRSWIGSRAERIREHKSHVTLAKGERVEVLGKKQVETEAGKSQLWLKIAPPVGEFRWVHSSQVRRAGNQDLAAGPLRPLASSLAPRLAKVKPDQSGDEPGKEKAAFRPSPIVLADLRDEKSERPAASRTRQNLPTDENPESDLYPVRPAAHEEPVEANHRGSLSPDGFVPRRRSSAAHSPADVSPRLAANPRGSPGAALRSDMPTRPATDPGFSGDASRELDELDLQLSLMLAKDKNTWNFSGLKDRATRLIDNGATPAERGQARFMLDKIKQLEEAFGIESVPVSAEPVRPTASKDFRPYDGEGWLTAVKSAQRPVAPYALVDEDGKRICFVSPAPGLNVSEHLNKHVGLYGRRGLVPDLNVPHVMASRVIDLERQLR